MRGSYRSESPITLYETVIVVRLQRVPIHPTQRPGVAISWPERKIHGDIDVLVVRGAMTNQKKTLLSYVPYHERNAQPESLPAMIVKMPGWV
jgi:hypothetical protein